MTLPLQFIRASQKLSKLSSRFAINCSMPSDSIFRVLLAEFKKEFFMIIQTLTLESINR